MGSAKRFPGLEVEDARGRGLRKFATCVSGQPWVSDGNINLLVQVHAVRIRVALSLPVCAPWYLKPVSRAVCK